MKRNVKDRLYSELLDIPLGVCIFLIVAGLVIGGIFVMGTWHWGALIDIEEAIPVSAAFAYDLH